jgi:hypothetical protein
MNQKAGHDESDKHYGHRKDHSLRVHLTPPLPAGPICHGP